MLRAAPRRSGFALLHRRCLSTTRDEGAMWRAELATIAWLSAVVHRDCPLSTTRPPRARVSAGFCSAESMVTSGCMGRCRRRAGSRHRSGKAMPGPTRPPGAREAAAARTFSEAV